LLSKVKRNPTQDLSNLYSNRILVDLPLPNLLGLLLGKERRVFPELLLGTLLLSAHLVKKLLVISTFTWPVALLDERIEAGKKNEHRVLWPLCAP